MHFHSNTLLANLYQLKNFLVCLITWDVSSIPLIPHKFLALKLLFFWQGALHVYHLLCEKPPPFPSIDFGLVASFDGV